jgi:hypothetical protein
MEVEDEEITFESVYDVCAFMKTMKKGREKSMMWKKTMKVLVTMLLLFSLIPAVTSSADYSEDDLIEVEAAPEDVTIDPIGKMKQINFIDENFEGKADFIGLYTSEFAREILVHL